MTHLHRAEQRERKLATIYFDKLNITDYFFSDIDSGNTTEGEYTDANGLKHIFEIKVRGKQYGTMMIEEMKYDEMMRKAQDDGCNYINIIRDGDDDYKVINFNLQAHTERWIDLDLSPEQIWQEQELPSKSCGDNPWEKKSKLRALLTVLECDTIITITE
jgi:hypothetical protein